MLFAKFALTTAVCVIGVFGTLKNKPILVRLYRDYSIADFAFMATLLPLILYTFLRRPLVRASGCEALARQPELLRDLLELGLTLENCESWLERAVLGGSAALVIYLVCRLHLLLAVSRYYSALVARNALPVYTPLISCTSSSQKVYVLPTHPSNPLVPMVYTPVPLDSIPESARSHISEAWLASATPSSSSRRHHHRRSNSGSNLTGKIALPIKADEGLFGSDAKF
jgi:hypothetical protein